MCSNYHGIQLEQVLQREEKIEHLSSFAHVVHAVVQKWKMHVQSVRKYHFLLSNMQICDVLVAVGLRGCLIKAWLN